MYSEPPPPSTRFTALAWAPLVALLGLFAVALWEYDPAAFVGDAAIVSLSQSAMCRGETGVKATRTFPSFLAANASQSSRMPAASRRRAPPIFLAAVAVCQVMRKKNCKRLEPFVLVLQHPLYRSSASIDTLVYLHTWDEVLVLHSA